LGEEVYISALPDTPQKDRKKILLKEKETVAIPTWTIRVSDNFRESLRSP
jgi:hypothetical protein